MKPETATKIVIALIWGIITLFSPAMGLEEMTAVSYKDELKET